jgi:DNA mismatch repair ATPase MutS
MAIADAVLQHLVENIKCKTLFITHYPIVAIDLERRFPDDVRNLHMGYTTDSRIDGKRDVTFLYRLTDGFAEESFGVECARLAGIPEHILSVATERSEACRTAIESRSRLNRCVTSTTKRLHVGLSVRFPEHDEMPDLLSNVSQSVILLRSRRSTQGLHRPHRCRL